MSSRGARYWSSGSIPLIGPDVLGDIIATASDLAIVISDIGEILSVLINPNHPSFGDLDQWEGRDIREVLTGESIPKLERQIEALTTGEILTRAMELNHVDQVNWEFPVRYTLHPIGPDGALLMLGRDLRPIAEMQEQLVSAQIALERDYEVQREHDTRFRVLMDEIDEAAIFITLGSGRISELNGAAANLLDAPVGDLRGGLLTQAIEPRRGGDLMELLMEAALTDLARGVEVSTLRGRKRLTAIPTVFRASGERFMLCRLESTDKAEVMTDELSENLNALYQEGSDAIVFTDKDGMIRAANEAFLNLTDLAHVALARGKPLADFFGRGSVDARILMENASRSGQMAVYSTRLVTEFGVETAVELSATYLNDRANPAFVFVIRDTSRAEAARRSGGRMTEDGVKGVMELVGTASLKEIVADTTDVIEKMCIETAIELTQNNRVAAAEMLGLSRQSLYVKLRKHGLIDRKDG